MKILISGEGGQGVQVLAQIITNVAYSQNLETSYIPHYGVEMRMGISFAYLQIQKKPIAYPKFDLADILVIMTLREKEISQKFISKNTRIINVINFQSELKNNNLPTKSLNMVVLGILVKELNTSEFRLDNNKIKEEIKNKLSGKDGLEDNLKAFNFGFMIDMEKYNIPLSSSKQQNFKPLENKDSKKKYYRFPNLCKGCGLCIEKCPVKALSWSENEINYIRRPIPKVDINKCTACQTCEHICPDSAIKVIKT